MFGKTLLPLMVALLVSAGPAAAQPTVFWFNDPVGPDETILVTGAELDAVTAVTIARLPDAGAPAAALAEPSAQILQANPQSLKVVVPADFTPGIFRLTLHYAEGSATIAVNLPTVYWAQGSLGEAVAPGGWVQIFGRNIVRRPDRAHLTLVPDGTGAAVTASLSDGGMWRARFCATRRIPPAAVQWRRRGQRMGRCRSSRGPRERPGVAAELRCARLWGEWRRQNGQHTGIQEDD
jgi:hypothetical protein